MVILRSENKITAFFMILAWASPFRGYEFAQKYFLMAFPPLSSPFPTSNQYDAMS